MDYGMFIVKNYEFVTQMLKKFGPSIILRRANAGQFNVKFP
jgi:hypothetical protein